MIAAVMCTWEEAQMVSLAVESTKDFVDEYVVVDKDSRDGTADRIRECASEWGLFTRIYNRRDMILRQARLFAVEQTEADWVLIQDGDEVFHTDGPNTILGFRPERNVSVYSAPMTYLYGDLRHTARQFGSAEVATQPPHRFLYWRDSVRPSRKKHGFEGLPGDDDIPDTDGREVTLPLVYKFNCNAKPPLRLFLRQFWFEWCNETDAWKTSSLEDYVKRKLKADDLVSVADRWYQETYASLPIYDEGRYGYYPKVIREYLRKNP